MMVALAQGKEGNEHARPSGVVIIAGPTASGKSALAVEFAADLGGVVINADAMQCYRDLPILTAQPSAADRAKAEHRLYGFLPPDKTLTAALWARMAAEEIERALRLGKVPIVVGGSGLYLRALVTGLSPIPPISERTRQAARSLLEDLGPEAMHAKLAEFDPAAASRLHPKDRQRIVRAWEVHAETGQALSEWQSRPAKGELARPAIAVLCQPDRSHLVAAIDARSRAMIEGGVLQEVRQLLGAAPAGLEAGAGRALGFAELSRHVKGTMTLEESVAALQKKTRQYAKRQVTWGRHQLDFDNFITINKYFSQLSAYEQHSLRYKIRSFLLTD